MSTIFISYAREDRQEAQNLAQECAFRGADPWWDRELASGERYIETILRQVEQADHFLLLLSAASSESTWVAFEVGAARAREAALDRDLIKIVNLDNSEVPGFIGERNATSLDGGGLRGLFRSLDLPEEVDYKPPAGPADRSLMVFRAGGQWMELIVSRRGLECTLVDVGEQRSRLQWQMPRDQALACRNQGTVAVEPPQPHRGWACFDVGNYHGWRWTPALFRRSDGPPPEQAFRDQLMELLDCIEDF